MAKHGLKSFIKIKFKFPNYVISVTELMYFIFEISAPVPMESILPPFQLLRDPNSGQFLFFPTAVPTAATSIGMLIAWI